MLRSQPLPPQAAVMTVLGVMLSSCASDPGPREPTPAPQSPPAAPQKRAADLAAVLREHVRALDAREQLRVDTATHLLTQVDPYGMGICREVLEDGRLVVAVVPSINALGAALSLSLSSEDSLLMVLPGAESSAVNPGLSLLLLDEAVASSMPLVIRACNREFITFQRFRSQGDIDHIGSIAERDSAAEARLRALILRLERSSEPALLQLARMLQQPTVSLPAPSDNLPPRQLTPRR